MAAVADAMTPERRAEIREHIARTRRKIACVDEWHTDLARDADDLLAEVERLQGWLGDYEATQARNAELLAEVERLQAKVAKDHAELRDKRTDLLNIRGILSPQPSVGDRVVPMPLGAEVAPAIEWLVAELERLRAELVEAHDDKDVIDSDATVWHDEFQQATAERNEARAEVERLRAELAQRCDKDDCEQFREWLSGEKAEADKRARQAEAERDEARTAQQRSDELLVGAHNDLCAALNVRHRPLLDVIQHAATIRAERDHLKDERNHAYTALRGVLRGTPATLRQGVELAAKTIRDHDAERDRIVEQVKRATDVRLLRFAISDPGAFTKRERFNDGDYETVPAWGARAVVLAVQNGGEQRG